MADATAAFSTASGAAGSAFFAAATVFDAVAAAGGAAVAAIATDKSPGKGAKVPMRRVAAVTVPRNAFLAPSIGLLNSLLLSLLET